MALTHESTDQLLCLLQLFREGFQAGEPLRRAYRNSVRQAAGRYGVTYQTMGDLCRRRLNLDRIGLFYALLERWMAGDARPLAERLKAASVTSAHHDIEAFFRAGGGPRAVVPAAAADSEVMSFRLPVREARMVRALAELEGLQAPELVRQLVGAVVEEKMQRVVRENRREPEPPPPRPRRSAEDIAGLLREHRAELRGMGVEHLALFGSAARGEAEASSDVDMAATMAPGFSAGGMDHLARIAALRERLATILAAPVDVVEEPVENPRLRRQIDRDRIVVF